MKIGIAITHDRAKPWSPQDYFKTVVLPMYERFRRDPIAIDLCVGTVISSFHTVDWIAEHKKESVEGTLKRIRELQPDFDYLHAATNALKHRKIDRSPKAHRGLSDFMTDAIYGNTRLGTAESRLLVPPRFIYDDGRDYSSMILLEFCLVALAKELGIFDDVNISPGQLDALGRDNSPEISFPDDTQTEDGILYLDLGPDITVGN